MKKLAVVLLVGCLLLVVFVGMLMMVIMEPGDVKKGLAASSAPADSTERIEELICLSEIGTPWDIVMMITTLQSEDEDEAKIKPFIDNALEFMVMTEVISELHHTCGRFNEDGSEILDEDAECNCEFKVVETNFYFYKDEILGYWANSGLDEELTVWNIEECLQAAADILAALREYESIITIQVNAIDDTLYEDAIIRCGITDPDIVDAIIQLHESGYYIEWLKEIADKMGVEVSEGIYIGGLNGTHSRIMAAIAGDTSPFVGESFGDPVSGWRGIISCEFAGYKGHTGIDFAVPIGTPVYASVSGMVIITGSSNTGYGNYVVINHGGGIATLYAHNSSVLVSAGQTVTQGQVIAYSGNTGNVDPKPTPENPTAGAHLHFEVVVNGIPKNPRGYLS